MIGLNIAVNVVSLLPPSSDTSFHCGSAIFSYSSSKSNLALLQSCKTFGFVSVNSLFISRPHQTKFHVRQGNCFILKLKLSSPSKFYNFWFCIGKLLVYKFHVFVFSRLSLNITRCYTAIKAEFVDIPSLLCTN